MKTHTTPRFNSLHDRSTKSNVTLLVFALLALFSLSSCNTTRGFGRDVQKVGAKIENTAERVAR